MSSGHKKRKETRKEKVKNKIYNKITKPLLKKTLFPMSDRLTDQVSCIDNGCFLVKVLFLHKKTAV